jgi:hypothetical protein
MSFGRRYKSVPPEAVPILDLGVDGCHYALWIDDVRTLAESPGVVRVSPTDSYPDQIRWIAPSIEVFLALIRPDDDWLIRQDESIARQRELAQQRRLRVVTVMTADGTGVVERGARQIDKVPTDPKVIQAELRDLVEHDAAPVALVLARNVIAGAGLQPPGFGQAVATVYEALGRPEYAAVALTSYELSEERWTMLTRAAEPKR